MERSVSTTEADALHGGLRAKDECRVVEEVGEGDSKVGKRAGAAKGKDVVGVSIEAVAEKEACEDNIVWLRMRLPKAEMVCLVKESGDVAKKKL
uniref:Uncharacterized protein n=1 Tax=Oryza meridionalis TaxID=40149 RepID=A0A0E0C3P0_9ORYZ